jgi:hypothetical protein
MHAVTSSQIYFFFTNRAIGKSFIFAQCALAN